MTDAEALASFETLVAAQRKVNWEPVTDYTFDARTEAEGQTPDLILSTFKPKRILDAGCGYGHLVRMLIERGADARGFDVKTRRDWLESPRFYVADLTDEQPASKGYDLVICREVLEHLTIKQIRKAVANLCDLSSKFVYLTTRFHPNPEHLLDVATTDALDPTHISMLNQDLLRALFVLEGFTRRADLEQVMDWKNLGRVLVYQR